MSWIERGIGWWLEQAVDAPAVHQVGADQPGKGERALRDLVGGVGETQQQEGDQGDGNLDAYRILRGAEKAGDLQRLLDPAKEQLNGPPAAVEIGDLLAVASRSLRAGARSCRSG